MGVSIKLAFSDGAADNLSEALTSSTGPIEFLLRENGEVAVRHSPMESWSPPLEGVTVERRLVW